MLFDELVRTSAAVAATTSRRAKVRAIANLLRRSAPGEVPIAVAFLSGELRQRQIGVGYAALRDIAGDPAWPASRRARGAASGRESAHVPVSEGGAAEDVDGADGDRAEAASTVTREVATGSTLTLTAVDAAFAQIGAAMGPGSQADRRRLLTTLFTSATGAERSFLVRLLAGDLRQGALEGIMIEAIAAAAEVDPAEVRRAHMLGGSLLAVAEAALGPAGYRNDHPPPAAPAAPGTLDDRRPPSPPGTLDDRRPPGGTPGERSAQALAALRSFRLQVGRPLQPMLASTADSIGAALARVRPAAVEWKIDGIRVMVHKDGGDVAVFTRTLDDITRRVPEVVAAAAALPARSVVLDGEVIALGPGGRPRPFQVTAGRIGTRSDVAKLAEQVPLTVFFFDLLHLDGADLVDRGGADRYAALAATLPAGLLIPRLVTGADAEAEGFYRDAVGHGHEGVLIKSLGAPYAAGRRGAGWIKVKPRHTLDLVVIAAEWGHGRRRGWLSNLHLAARDPAAGGYVMLGKTFKGLTDEVLTWQTARLLKLADPARPPPGAAGSAYSAHGVVRVRPELVAEIAFDGVQASPRYPGGLALRFARVIRYRPDKRAADADTIGTVRQIARASGVSSPTAYS